MYQLWSTSRSFRTRPSDLLGIPNTEEFAWERFEIDTAVAGLGNFIDNKLGEYTEVPEGSKESPKIKYKTVAEVIALSKPGKVKLISKKPKTDVPAKPPPPPKIKRNPKGRRK